MTVLRVQAIDFVQEKPIYLKSIYRRDRCYKLERMSPNPSPNPAWVRRIENKIGLLPESSIRVILAPIK